MTDRPIIFSAPMIRSLIEGRKSQTRRILKPQPDASKLSPPFRPEPRGGRSWVFMQRIDFPGYAFAGADFRVPYAVGDRLWVREAWRTETRNDEIKPANLRVGSSIYYEADDAERTAGRLRPSIFMPRWASRMTLVVTEVRVERLQEIGEADAFAEGVAPTADWKPAPFKQFRELWNSLHGTDAWDANPFVAVEAFRTILANIDAPEARAA